MNVKPKSNFIGKMILRFRKLAVLATRTFLRVLWVFKVDKNKVLFMSFNGKQYSDSPKSISGELLNTHSNITQVWAFKNKSQFNHLEKNGIIIVSTSSLKFLYHILTARVIVVNDFTNTFIPIRKCQTLLNTWHGGGSFKTVGMTSKSRNDYDEFFFKIHRKMTNIFSSSSSYFNKTVLFDSFLYNGEIIECGMPRNDILFKDNPKIIEKIKAHFGINEEKKIVLYAPTHRNTDNSLEFLIDDNEKIHVNNCLEALRGKFSSDFCFLFRAHHLISHDFDSDLVFNASDYPDMQELLYAADVLITDYSSCMWDFSLMKKPIFVFATDIDKYSRERDFFMDIYEWPFSIARNNQQLSKNIKEFNKLKYRNGVDKYIEELGSFETGVATKQISELIVGKYLNHKQNF